MPTKMSPCTYGWPVKTDVLDYVNAIARGDYGKAMHLIRTANPFASVCGWCEDRRRYGLIPQGADCGTGLGY